MDNNSITKIWVPESVKIIEQNAFYSCSSLEYVYLPASLRELQCATFDEAGWKDQGQNPFLDCGSLKRIVCNENNNFYMTEENVLYSKDRSKLMAVGNDYRKEDFNVPDGVVEIYQNAFFYNKYIKRINISSSVKCMNYALERLSALTEINVSSENCALASKDGVLYNHSFTELIKVPFAKVDSFVIPEGVKKISAHAFISSKLSYIVMPDTVKEIGEACFYDADNLEQMRLSNQLLNSRKNENLTFLFCRSGIKRLEIPEGIKCIPSKLCYDCQQLSEIVIPASVKEIYYDKDEKEVDQNLMFCEGCISIERIIVNEGNANYKSVNDVLYDKAMRKIVSYPPAKKDTKFIVNKKVNLEAGAFSNLQYLKYVKFTKGIKQYDGFAPFVQCENLKVELADDSDISSVGCNFFKECKNCKLLVHKNSKIQKQAKKYKIPYQIIK